MSTYVDLLARVPVSVSARGNNRYRKVLRLDEKAVSGWIKVAGVWQEFADGGWRTVTERTSYKDHARLLIELDSGRYQAL